MSRFNIRAITTEAIIPPAVTGKPSAYSAMKHGTSVPTNTVIMPTEEPKKKGRPSKEEARKHKLQLADAGIQMLVENKPTRNKIREYFQTRIEQLDEEKR